MSPAVTKDENLVYAKAYGNAVVSSNTAVTNNNLFRLASVSKQLISTAIMKLPDQGTIYLSDKLFGSGAILGTIFGTQPYTTNITNITVDKLLHSMAGRWPNNGSDPMFTNPSMTAAQIIGRTLDNRPLTDAPGASPLISAPTTIIYPGLLWEIPTHGPTTNSFN